LSDYPGCAKKKRALYAQSSVRALREGRYLFKKLLVANRGEIALRVMRTCREMGIRTVAVYSDVDRLALHVRYGDEAYLLGPGAPRESYLNIERIVEVAKRCGAEAIHPGYGFLAENAAFADACEQSDIVFVGPSAGTMRLMGNKVAARRLAADAGVPVVPGEESAASPDEARATAERLGYPVLIKAVAGGGGKGIRLVRSAQEMEAALRVAGSEAATAFGDHSLYVEKLLEPVRHVEVQFLADGQGKVVTLGERECSIQRRHQKLIEESPSTVLDSSLRERLCAQTATIAGTSSYRNAGTVEFLLDDGGKAYFLEVNTRLQVEHPVTELVTGIDLVAEQLRIAAGEGMSYRQEDIRLSGWALECRIAAEDPFNDFLPSLGRIDYVSEPSGPGIRVDSALCAGGDITYYYDPMVAKVITWGRTREEAIERMRRALGEFVVVGVETNIPFHLQILSDSRFRAGQLHTGLLENEFSLAVPSAGEEERTAMLAAALLTHRRRNQPTGAGLSGDGGGWRAAGRQAEIRGQAWATRGGEWRRNID
jgi:acetyl-CoA carboxylase biotin carboxylase subunit